MTKLACDLHVNTCMYASMYALSYLSIYRLVYLIIGLYFICLLPAILMYSFSYESVDIISSRFPAGVCICISPRAPQVLLFPTTPIWAASFLHHFALPLGPSLALAALPIMLLSVCFYVSLLSHIFYVIYCCFISFTSVPDFRIFF